MSIHVRTVDWDDSKDCAVCNNSTFGVLELNSIKIPLCIDCLEDMKEELNRFCKPQYCYQCKHFIMSKYGWNNGGSCCKLGPTNPDNAGWDQYSKCTMDTCNDFELKEN